jgi:tRNA pseudouridine38-40 synthase
MMARYQIILAYDGTDFAGFQKQANARTVQGVFEEALRRLTWEGSSILAAGRTDTGVHASGQVVAFDLDWRHSGQDLMQALNAHLPPDVAVQQASIARANFHPRYDASARWYRYHLFCQPQRHPLWERYAWRVWPAVNLDWMKQPASLLAGRHDFRAFGSPPHPGGSTVRTIHQAEWREDTGALGQTLFTFDVSADAFLYHMVRRLVHLLVEVGQGRIESSTVQGYLDPEQPRLVQGMAPPQGLFLRWVEFNRSSGSGENDQSKL